jgi:FMN phosphatase YigB (HAD superfamily)/glutathione synthase/RimK-type ligase-like ATP-grasp enzyme
MKKQYKILFTCVGRRVELVQAFISEGIQLGIDLIVHGTDVSENAPALYFCNKRHNICSISDPNYIPELLKICKNEKIDMVIPTIDIDLLLLAEHRDMFLAHGTTVLISDKETIRICRDKRITAEFFQKCDLKVPFTVDNICKYHGEYPCFIKPVDGSSSTNAYKVNTKDDLILYSSIIDNYIVQPYIKGTEYTVDVFCDYEGNIICITPRLRLQVRGGEVIKTEIVKDQKIIRECISIVRELRPMGPLTIQLIRQNDTNDDYFIEINPRFGGGVTSSISAGANSIKALLELMQDSYTKQTLEAQEGLIFCRFDQSICLKKAKNCLVEREYKAVILDLDDTLYSEKEYIKSGFREIEKQFGCINNAYESLWDAFLKGERAIDYVLNEQGIYSEKLADECLECYRTHLPDIRLYSGIEKTLRNLKESGVKLGLITDGRPEGQRAKIHALGIGELFNEIIITDELGGPQFRKPNDIAFRLMQGKFGIPYEMMVYIGDNPDKDFDAPNSLGMGSIYFANKDGLYSRESICSFETYRTINELISRLARMGHGK